MATFVILPANCGDCSDRTVEADEIRFEEDSGIVIFRKNLHTIGFISIRNVVAVVKVPEAEK